MSALDLLHARFRGVGQPLAANVFFLAYAVQDSAAPVWAKVRASAALAARLFGARGEATA